MRNRSLYTVEVDGCALRVVGAPLQRGSPALEETVPQRSPYPLSPQAERCALLCCHPDLEEIEEMGMGEGRG